MDERTKRVSLRLRYSLPTPAHAFCSLSVSHAKKKIRKSCRGGRIYRIKYKCSRAQSPVGVKQPAIHQTYYASVMLINLYSPTTTLLNADPSSMKDAFSHINYVKWPCSSRILVAHWIECNPPPPPPRFLG